MMKWKPVVLCLATVGAIPLFGATSAFASTSTGYDPRSDTTVNVLSSGSTSSSGSLGSTTFDLQESAYQTTGLDVPHDYVWVNVLGTSVLAVDPPKFMF
ncbi:MAG: hypothetical protein K6T78_15470 [Alicyclobacillus sp.]|nr:hypothetical protein [Alicyclobacillus sp.]